MVAYPFFCIFRIFENMTPSAKAELQKLVTALSEEQAQMLLNQLKELLEPDNIDWHNEEITRRLDNKGDASYTWEEVLAHIRQQRA